jgi:hypothetical protein
VHNEKGKEGRYLIGLAHEGTMGSASHTHWHPMGIGGRIPPLLAAFARLFCRILPKFENEKSRIRISCRLG